MHNTYRLLDVLLYNTEIYLDEYTALKVILDEPLGESNMTFQAVYDVHVHLFNRNHVHVFNRPIRKNTDFFWIQYGKILDGHVVQIKDAHWMNL